MKMWLELVIALQQQQEMTGLLIQRVNAAAVTEVSLFLSCSVVQISKNASLI